jgi:hypothetical protein
MPDDRDHYQAYYADKLWNLLPAIYRSQDTDDFDQAGPLRELVNRIGEQAAILRRSIDRMWEDQSIETCDDWVIPYIGDLLATNLVASLDARGQRLDVAKTIYYRRRKGTLGILEEIATDITGWDARVQEFFRRMGRTRHGLDPEIGAPQDTSDPVEAAELQLAEGLVGRWTHTGIGGWADLRNVYGAAKTDSAFDEFFHTADFRRGRGQVGWYNIPKLGAFLWRLYSFGLDQTTPVPVRNCPGRYSFDPTGRQIPLFAKSSRTKDANYGDSWVSPQEQQLPTPIQKRLLDAQLAALYPASLGVLRESVGQYDLVDPGELTIYPELGRFRVNNPPTNDVVYGIYHYGFPSTIGAGPYDRFLPGTPPSPLPGSEQIVQNQQPLGVASPVATTTIADSLTYDNPANVAGIQQVTLRAASLKRPLVRLPAPALNPSEWVFTGDDGSSLVLEGLFVSGGDIVLRGKFASVTVTCCTFDPGTAGDKEHPPADFATSVDGRLLTSTTLWVEAEVRNLLVDRSITGPIRTRANGEIQELKINDSIVQAVPVPMQPAFALEMHQGVMALSRCTILGPVAAHRFDASECILDEIVTVDDTQHGCVRFTAWTQGSVIPRQYESLTVNARSGLFTSRDFGDPGYGQLLPTADAAIISTPAGTIVAGAQDGSEMGAFAREKNPIKERSLLIKFNEFMPLGLTPVIIYVT